MLVEIRSRRPCCPADAGHRIRESPRDTEDAERDAELRRPRARGARRERQRHRARRAFVERVADAAWRRERKVGGVPARECEAVDRELQPGGVADGKHCGRRRVTDGLRREVDPVRVRIRGGDVSRAVVQRRGKIHRRRRRRGVGNDVQRCRPARRAEARVQRQIDSTAIAGWKRRVRRARSGHREFLGLRAVDHQRLDGQRGVARVGHEHRLNGARDLRGNATEIDLRAAQRDSRRGMEDRCRRCEHDRRDHSPGTALMTARRAPRPAIGALEKRHVLPSVLFRRSPADARTA